jgi:mannitol-specific phosphotransferase system IIBC component
METPGIILLVICGVISFAVGRFIVHMRNIKRQRKAAESQAQMRRNRPAEPEAKNKAKRKRQLQELEKASRRSGK